MTPLQELHREERDMRTILCRVPEEILEQARADREALLAAARTGDTEALDQADNIGSLLREILEAREGKINRYAEGGMIDRMTSTRVHEVALYGKLVRCYEEIRTAIRDFYKAEGVADL